MKEKFPYSSSIKQGQKITEILNLDLSIDHSFDISDIFKYLPHSITFNGHRGDLCVSTVDIAYFSIDSDWEHILVHHEPIPIGGDVYDAFIAMIKWLQENNLM